LLGSNPTKNLTIFPLFSSYTLDLDYLMLDEALSEGVTEIVEVGREGTVPQLKVVNKSPKMVLILDGEELVGAKQNRIVNTTILIQGNTTVVIPVSCVEQGRWFYDSPRFSSKERVMSPSLRAMKSEQVQFSLRSSGDYRSDQGAIWEEISEKAERRGARSPSMAMAEIYESSVTYCQNKENRKRKYDDGLVYQKAYDEYQKALNDPNFRSEARRRMNNLKPYLPTDEEKFMNQNRQDLKETCYTEWMN